MRRKYFIILTVLAMLVFTASPVHAQFTGGRGDGSDYADGLGFLLFAGGSGDGWDYRGLSSPVVLAYVGFARGTGVAFIRAGATIYSISRTNNIVQVTLSAPYPNNNLKAGQKIVIDLGSGGSSSFNGVFQISQVASQQVFSYGQLGSDASGVLGSFPVAGGDYSTLTTWQAALFSDLTFSGNPATAECYNDWPSGLADSIDLTNVSNVSCYVKIFAPSSERNTGTSGTGFRISPSSGNAITVSGGYVWLDRIEATGPVALTAGTLVTGAGSLYTGGLTIGENTTLQLGGKSFTGMGAVTLPVVSTIVYTGLQSDDTAGAVTLLNAAHHHLTLSPTAPTTFNLPAANFDVNGNLTINVSAVLDATANNYNMSVAGNWSNSGSFTARAGTVTLDGTLQSISGSSAFYNLTKAVAAADTLRFAAGATQTIASGGLLTLNGASGNLLSLRSSSAGNSWGLTIQGSSSVNYVDVQDSDASGGAVVTAGNSVPSGNNNNWAFPGKSLTGTNVEPVSLVAGITGNVTVSFTTVNSLPADGKIKITFPSGFTLSSGGATAVSSASGIDGSFSVGIVGQVVTLTRSAGTSSAPGAKSLTLTNIKNPNDMGSTGVYALETQNASGTVFDSDNAVSSDTITNGGTLTSTDVAPYGAPTPLAGTSGNCVISFTTVNPIPADGKIVVTFPSGFAFDSGGTTAVSGTPTGLDGLFAVGKAGQVVTITRSNGTQSAAGAKTITLSYVQNPTAKGSTGTYAIQTNTASSSLTTGEIDIDAAVAADMIFFVDLTSWNLDMNAGTLTMNFNVAVDKSTLAATGITIQDAATASSGKSYTLTGGTTNSSNGTTIVVNLTATDINGIKAINGMAKSQSNSYICITSATIKDTNTPVANSVSAITNGSAMQCAAGGYTADTTAPTLSSWTLDMNAGQAALTFNKPIAISTLDKTKFTLQDTSGGTHTYALAGTYGSGTYGSLSAGQYGIGSTSNTVLQIKFAATDLNAIKADANIAKAIGSSYLVIAASSGVQDTATTPNALGAVSATAAGGYTADTTAPTLSSWTLDMATGQIALTFSESMKASSLDVTKVIVQDAVTATNGKAYTLTDSTGSNTNSTGITITLSTTDLNAIKAIEGMGKAQNNSYIRFGISAITDTAATPNALAAIADGSAMQVTTYTPDAAAPGLASWTLNMNTQTLELTFNEPVAISTFDKAKFKIQDDASGTHAYVLAGTYALGTYGSLTSGQYAIGTTSNLKLQIKLATADFNALVADANIAKAQASSYLVIASGSGLQDMAATPNVLGAVSATNATTYTANAGTAVYFKVTSTGGITSTSMTADDAAKDVILTAYDASWYCVPAYGGTGGQTKTIVFSGANASPDGNKPLAGGSENGFTAGVGIPITFTNGTASTTVRLFNRETALIAATDTANSVSTLDAFRLTIAVSPGANNKLVFTQQPPSTGTINVALTPNPKVEIRDTYGNRTDDTGSIIYLVPSATSSTSNIVSVDGYLGTSSIQPGDQVFALTSNGVVTFPGLYYDDISTSPIYLIASGNNLVAAASGGITFSVAGTSTVVAVNDIAYSPTDTPTPSSLTLPAVGTTSVLNIIATKDTTNTSTNKMEVLKFKIHDAGEDGLDTVIDQIKITVAGGHASHDIAWAGLYTAGNTLVATATAAAGNIHDDAIIFGSAQNSDGKGHLTAVPDDAGSRILNGPIGGSGNTVEYTLYICMTQDRLQAPEGTTLSFSINEAGIYTDLGYSSHMTAPPQTNRVATVTKAIEVDATRLAVVDRATGDLTNLTMNFTAGDSGKSVEVITVDANKNIDTRYNSIPMTLQFSGLHSVAIKNTLDPQNPVTTTSNPKISNKSLPASVTSMFTNGVTSSLTLAAFAAETVDLNVVDISSPSHPTITNNTFNLSVTVLPKSLSCLSKPVSNDGDGQSGVINADLSSSLKVLASDEYGNPYQGVDITFTRGTEPSGATGLKINNVLQDTPTPVTVSTGSNGLASVALRLGNTAGDYIVAAAGTGLTDLGGMFTSHVVAPSALEQTSGPTSGTVGQILGDPVSDIPNLCKVQVKAGSLGVSNVNVNFVVTGPDNNATLTNTATSATSQTLTVATDPSGYASAQLTLGHKSGTYTVTATYGTLIPVTFNVQANADVPDHIAITNANSSVEAGTLSTPFALSILDHYNNETSFGTDATSFNLTAKESSTTVSRLGVGTGKIYDSNGTTLLTGDPVSVSIAANASIKTFYYKDSATTTIVTGSLAIGADCIRSGFLKQAAFSLDVVPAGTTPDHFGLAASPATLTVTDPATGSSSTALTIKAYDNLGNVNTSYTADSSMYFFGALASPAPNSKTPTVSDKSSADKDFGTLTTIHFVNGVSNPVPVLKLYRVEDGGTNILASTASTGVGHGGIDTPTALHVVVKHGVPDHLKFDGNIVPDSTPIAGSAFNFHTAIDVVDYYNNICDTTNQATGYNSSKIVSWTLSTGKHDGPENGQDIYPSDSTIPIVFTDGRSPDTLSATFCYAQTASLTASISTLPGFSQGRDVASNPVTVAPDTTHSLHLRFSTPPQTPQTTYKQFSAAVAVADQYGNPVAGKTEPITVRASLSGTGYTPTVNGSLSPKTATVSLDVNTGIATFTGFSYNYPEDIFLEAYAAGVYYTNLPGHIFSPISFKTIAEVSIDTQTAQPAATISSLATGDATKAAAVFAFKLSDAGNDGYATKIRQVVIHNTDSSMNWSDYIAAAYLSDGTVSLPAAQLANNKITFDATGIFSILDGNSKTYTMSLVLKAPLPAGADNKPLSFNLDASAGDITLDPVGSQFPSNLTSANAAVANSAVITVVATNFKITADPSMVQNNVPTLAAGTSGKITLTATDANNNIDSADSTAGYNGTKSLVFSGANTAPDGIHQPQVTTGGGTQNFGVPVVVSFANGVSTSDIEITPYKAEAAIIKVAETGKIVTADADALIVSVIGGAAHQLFWKTAPFAGAVQPSGGTNKGMAVANAFWNEFVVSVTDPYGNTAPSSLPVTINLSTGINYGTNCPKTGGYTVNAVNGEAHFKNFSVNASAYPATLFVTADAGGTVLPTSSYGPIEIDGAYHVVLDVRDSVSNANLPDLQSVSVTQSGATVYTSAGNPPFKFDLAGGTYSLSLNKDTYVQTNQDVTTDTTSDLTDGINDNTIHWTLYMTSVEEATADYQVKSTFVYDENSDGLTMRLWMERRGKLVLNAVDNINKLGGAQVQIFDTNTTVPIYTLSTAAGTMSGISSNDTTSSVFLEQLAKVTSPTSPVVLMPGKTYFAQCGIYYGDPNSPPLKYYQTGTTFTITTNEAVKQIQAMSTQIQSEVSGVKTQVATESATIQGKVAEVQGQTGQILTATQTTLPQQITAKTSEVKTEVTTAAKSAILNRENTVMLGSSLLIRYRTYEGAAPVISVYDPKGVARIASAPMKASTAPGIYEYSVLFTAGWPQGDYSVVCSEPTYDTMDAITITARTTDIANISSDVSAVLGSVSPIKDIKAQVESFSAAFNVIEDNIRKASEVMASIKAGTTDMSDVTDRMTSLFNTLKEMSTKIKEIGAGVGGDIEKLYEVSESKSKDINYIRNKTQELKALMLMSQQMMESTAKEEPVVQTWFEYR